MKNLIIIFIYLLSILSYSEAHSKSKYNNDLDSKILEIKESLYEGSILRDTLLIQKAKTILDSISDVNNKYKLYFEAQVHYELVRLGMALKDNNLFERNYDAAVDKIALLKKKHKNWSELNALLASLYGYKIGRNWANALIFGPKGYFEAEDAVKHDSLNPRAWLVRAIMKLNTPKTFGGSVQQSIEYFKKSIKLYYINKSKKSVEPSWGYIDAYLWLGWAYQKIEDYEKALSAYKEALKIEPRAVWIKEMFLEPLENKSSE